MKHGGRSSEHRRGCREGERSGHSGHPYSAHCQAGHGSLFQRVNAWGGYSCPHSCCCSQIPGCRERVCRQFRENYAGRNVEKADLTVFKSIVFVSSLSSWRYRDAFSTFQPCKNHAPIPSRLESSHAPSRGTSCTRESCAAFAPW